PTLRVITRVEERSGAWATTYRGSLLREIHTVVPAARITIECGGLSRLDPLDVEAHELACLNVVRGLGMMAGDLAKPSEPLIRTSANALLCPLERAFWVSQVSTEDRARTGQPVVQVTYIYEDVREESQSTYAVTVRSI